MSYVRQPAVAGSFYPETKEDITQMISRFMHSADKTLTGLESQIRIIVAPHAGFEYSGKTAAHSYKNIAGLQFDTIVLIGPQHTRYFDGAALCAEGVWMTPIGEMIIDSEFANALLSQNSDIINRPMYHEGEHSLEVQIPFLQYIQSNAKIVPIVTNDTEFAPALGDAILATVQKTGKKVLIIISTDCSHYCEDSVTRSRDEKTINSISQLNYSQLERLVDTGEGELCGPAGVLAAIHIMNQLPSAKLKVLDYSTSADASNDYSRTVGYLSAAGLADSWEGSSELSDEQKRLLLRIARNSLENLESAPDIGINDPALNSHRAVFVTLNLDGKLRGCVGRIMPEEELWRAVYNMTQDAALRDHRFDPVTDEEIEDIVISISVLSAPQLVASADEIRYPGHGVIVENGFRRGVFLPEVAEHFPTKESFLGALCTEKAGIPEDAWRYPDTKLFVFETMNFSE